MKMQVVLKFQNNILKNSSEVKDSKKVSVIFRKEKHEIL